jgi:hypothetical protein
MGLENRVPSLAEIFARGGASEEDDEVEPAASEFMLRLAVVGAIPDDPPEEAQRSSR